MNVLILTPDRVGSTLLQRVLTIYMLRKGFDQPVINLHELTNGIIKYIHSEMQIEVLGKPGEANDRSAWGYWQSLPEVLEHLKGANHYVTARLAHYHLKRRNDSLDEQLNLFEYLNENFYIIRTERDNLFEHALSWVIRANVGSKNSYNPAEKYETFNDIYKNKITATREGIRKKLSEYKEYIEWSDRYFDIQSHFEYGKSMNNLEEYILGLDFMSDEPDKTWESMFGVDFNNWNRCHKLVADVALMPQADQATIEYTPPLLISDERSRKAHNEMVLQNDKPKSVMITKPQYEFLSKYGETYKESHDKINDAVNSGFMPSNIPIKLQTFKEKRELLKNFDECIMWYNEWVLDNNFGELYSDDQFEDLSSNEEDNINNLNISNRLK